METDTQENTKLTNNSNETFILYKYRWFILFLSGFASFCSVILKMTFASVQSGVLIYYKLGNATWKVNLFPMIVMILNIPATILSNFILKKTSLRTTILIGAALNAVSSIIRSIFGYFPFEWAFWMMFIGQILTAISFPFTTFIQTTMAANWFGANERNLATALVALIGLFGSAFAFLLGVIVDTKTGNRIFIVLLIDAIICTFAFVLIAIFYKSNPPTPPTISIEEKEEKSNWKDYLEAVKNGPMIILGIVYMIGYGATQSFAALINQFVSPAGYSSIDSSIFGFLLIISGLIGAVIISTILDKTKRYLLMMWICAIAVAIALIGYGILIEFQKRIMLFILMIGCSLTLGFFGVVFIPICNQLAAEITYPVPPNISQGLLGNLANLATILFMVLFDLLQDKSGGKKGSMTISMWTCVGLFLFAVFLLIFFRPKYKRMEHERLALLKNKGGIDATNNDEEVPFYSH